MFSLLTIKAYLEAIIFNSNGVNSVEILIIESSIFKDVTLLFAAVNLFNNAILSTYDSFI